MYWTLELATYLTDAPWPANKDELIDFCIRTGAPLEVIENLQEIEEKKKKLMNQYLKFGRIIPLMKIIFGTRMNIKHKKLYKKSHLRLFFYLNLNRK